MGIKGLKTILKKNAPGSFSEINISSLKGSTICIDSSILLYKFRYMYNTDNFHILGFLNKIIELLTFRIIPVFIFDGKPPDAKKEILNKRSENKSKLKERIDILTKERELISPEFIDSDSEEDNSSKLSLIDKELTTLQKNLLNITKKHIEDVLNLLKSIGIPFFIADSEAEEYCSFLQKNNYVDYILTEDTDSLTFGGNKILFNIPGNKNKFCLCELKKVLIELEINYDEFIDFCILCGCDYTCKIPKIGPISALNIIKTHRNIEAFISQNNKYNIPENFNYELARELFKKNNEFEKINKIINFDNFIKESFNKIILENRIKNLNFENKIINLINLFPKKFLE